MRRVVVVSIVALLAGGVAWVSWRRAPRPPARPQILVYLIDTLRADRLGCYGYARARTPAMDRLARGATLFARAYSPSSWTKPAVGSLLTGLQPAEHGAVGRENRLREVATLAEVVRSGGYTTAAFVSNPNVLPVFGFDRGFDTFVDVESVQRSGTADRVHGEVLRFLDGHPERPLFLYVHTRDPHAPYSAPRPWDRVFPGQGGRTEYVNALYDGEIAYADRELGRLLRELRARGLDAEALIVLLSDHGEEFLDHGGILHGKTLYEEQIRVPLIVKRPGRARPGAVDRRAVRILDLVPGLCSLLDLETPPGVGGSSFLGTAEGGSDPEPSPLLAELDVDGRRMTALVRGTHKLIDQSLPEDSAGRRLYDLDRDPGEIEDLAGSEPERADGMAEALEALLADRRRGIRLELVNGPGPDEAHVLSGSLAVESGTVARLEPSDLEPGDRVTLSADGTRIDFELTLANWIDPVARPPVRRVDRDWIRAVPSEEGARFVLSVASDGVPLPPEEIPGDAAGVRAPAPENGPACRIYEATTAPGERVVIDEELDERLRALGYVE